MYPLHARVVEGEVTALRLGERPDLHRGDVRELRLQVPAHGVPYLRQRQTIGLTRKQQPEPLRRVDCQRLIPHLDAAVAGRQGEEVGGGAEGGEEVANRGGGRRHGRAGRMVVAAAAGGEGEEGFMRRRVRGRVLRELPFERVVGAYLSRRDLGRFRFVALGTRLSRTRRTG